MKGRDLAPSGHPGPEAADLTEDLVARVRDGRGGVVTWLNHYTAQRCLDADIAVDEFDLVGLDGTLLVHLVRSRVTRTSADLVLPVLLARCSGLRVALVGSTPEVLAAVQEEIEAGGQGHRVVLALDGYTGLPAVAELRQRLVEVAPHLVVVGLGAPRQDFVALGLRLPGVVVATCGGWLDQFAQGEYYPAWAYPLRLNWLVRLCREPRRLWRRYTIDAVTAVTRRQSLTVYVARARTRSTDLRPASRTRSTEEPPC